jgi:hypothetical protein
MYNVIDFKSFIPAGNEISGIGHTEGVSYSLCSPGDHYYTRVYFCVNNPVPKTGANGAFANQTLKANVLKTIPVDLNTQYCTNCALTLDNTSLSKGMTLQNQSVRWRPRSPNIGNNTGSITLTVSGSYSNTESFSIAVTDNPVISPMAGLLLK